MRTPSPRLRTELCFSAGDGLCCRRIGAMQRRRSGLPAATASILTIDRAASLHQPEKNEGRLCYVHERVGQTRPQWTPTTVLVTLKLRRLAGRRRPSFKRMPSLKPGRASLYRPDFDQRPLPIMAE